MINKLAKLDKLIKYQFSRVFSDNEKNHLEVLNLINNYLSEYIDFLKMPLDQVLDKYYKFVIRYNDDLNYFKETGLFPFQNPINRKFDIDRITYDVVLIMTALVLKHRFRIMKNIYETEVNGYNGLVVGVGSGLELIMIQDKIKDLDVYDFNISDFCKRKFDKLNFFEKTFSPEADKKYDVIFAIELLEHLRNPYGILKGFSLSLKQNGKIIVTTTKNVPQFDHLYNFSNEHEFEENIKELGLAIVVQEKIKHDYTFLRVDAYNMFYVLKKVI